MKSTLERGFKTAAERTSASIRAELGLGPCDRLDPRDLAHYLGVLLWTPSDVPNLPRDVLQQLLDRDPSGWSAVTVLISSTAIVIHNPRNSSGRQASDISHELAHLILGHEPARLIMSYDGSLVMRSYDQKQEDEASWLGWALLLPRDGLLTLRRQNLSALQIASHLGVSETLVRYRLGVTGVESHLRNASRYRRRKI